MKVTTIDSLIDSASRVSHILTEIQTYSHITKTTKENKLEILKSIQAARDHARDHYYTLALMVGTPEEADIVAGII